MSKFSLRYEFYLQFKSNVILRGLFGLLFQVSFGSLLRLPCGCNGKPRLWSVPIACKYLRKYVHFLSEVQTAATIISIIVISVCPLNEDQRKSIQIGTIRFSRAFIRLSLKFLLCPFLLQLSAKCFSLQMLFIVH